MREVRNNSENVSYDIAHQLTYTCSPMRTTEMRSMMRRDGHTTRSRTPRVHRGFDKTTHNLCPRCRSHNLAVYFNSGSPRKVGALCYSCGLVGFFARNDFFEIAKLTSDLPSTIGNHLVCKQ